jgi:hypothetical protein
MATLYGASQPYLGAVPYYFLLLLSLNAHSTKEISIFKWELAVYMLYLTLRAQVAFIFVQIRLIARDPAEISVRCRSRSSAL